MAEKRIELYRQAYALIGRETPITADCGKLCGSRCCIGDEERGMLVFPGEEELLEGLDFLRLKKEPLFGGEAGFAVCLGSCARPKRPLSCRIFPLAPFIGPEGRLKIVFDPRARYICPLTSARDMLSPSFKHSVRRAFSLLCRDEGIKGFIKSYSAVLMDYALIMGERL